MGEVGDGCGCGVMFEFEEEGVLVVVGGVVGVDYVGKECDVFLFCVFFDVE